MAITSVIAGLVDAQARWVTNWLHSRAAFLWLVYGTVLWIPFVILGLDPHGFLYLYIATSLSLVTQPPLAMLAFWASRDARKAEELIAQTLKNQTDMMKLLLDKFGEFEQDLDDIEKEIEAVYGEESK